MSVDFVLDVNLLASEARNCRLVELSGDSLVHIGSVAIKFNDKCLGWSRAIREPGGTMFDRHGLSMSWRSRR